MASPKKGRPLGFLLMALAFYVLAVQNFVGARRAAADHSVVFYPDRIGGLGDTWMLPGQSYFLSALCLGFTMYGLIAFLRRWRP